MQKYFVGTFLSQPCEVRGLRTARGPESCRVRDVLRFMMRYLNYLKKPHKSDPWFMHLEGCAPRGIRAEVEILTVIIKKNHVACSFTIYVQSLLRCKDQGHLHWLLRPGTGCHEPF